MSSKASDCLGFETFLLEPPTSFGYPKTDDPKMQAAPGKPAQREAASSAAREALLDQYIAC
eukprot:2140777-Amphidinium_carterae.1